jgi:glutamate/tyrosine decarboxylase-like PLP-dependent enzyme
LQPRVLASRRGTGVYATLRSLGRRGVEQLVDRTCALARRFAAALAASGKAGILNDVVFNQVLVRWLAPGGDHLAFNDRVIDRIQRDGTAFFSGTTWNGMRLMRISVSDWGTDEGDVDRGGGGRAAEMRGVGLTPTAAVRRRGEVVSRRPRT